MVTFSHLYSLPRREKRLTAKNNTCKCLSQKQIGDVICANWAQLKINLAGRSFEIGLSEMPSYLFKTKTKMEDTCTATADVRLAGKWHVEDTRDWRDERQGPGQHTWREFGLLFEKTTVRCRELLRGGSGEGWCEETGDLNSVIMSLCTQVWPHCQT